MSAEKTETNTGAPKGLGWRLFSVSSKLNTQLFALIILLLLAWQALYGLFENEPSTYDFYTFSYGKALLIKLFGFLGLLNWGTDLFNRAFVHRGRVFKWTFIKRPWTGFLAILLFWAVCAILIATDKRLAIFGGAYRYEGITGYIAYAGIFLNASIIKDEKYRRILFGFIAVTSALLAGLTLLRELAGVTFLMERNGQTVPYSSTFLNSNHYGYYICVSLTVTAGLYMMSDKLWGKIVCGVCFGLNAAVLMFNSTLGAFIASAVGLVLLFALYWIRKGFKKAWPALILIAAFALMSVVLNEHKMLTDFKLFTEQTEDATAALNSGGTSSGTGSDGTETTDDGQTAIDTFGSGRGKLWRKTIDVILEHPVIGVGTDNVQHYIGNEIPHNEFLQVAANLGFPGLAFYLAALVSLFAAYVKNTKKLTDGALIAGIAVIVYCVSAFVGISLPIAAYQLFLFLGLLNGWFRARDDEKMIAETMEEIKRKQEELSKQVSGI